MAAVVVQYVENASASNATFSSHNFAGNAIVANFLFYYTSPLGTCTVSDSAGNTYADCGTDKQLYSYAPSQYYYIQTFVSTGIKGYGKLNKVTAACTNATWIDAWIVEVSGLSSVASALSPGSDAIINNDPAYTTNGNMVIGPLALANGRWFAVAFIIYGNWTTSQTSGTTWTSLGAFATWGIVQCLGFTSSSVRAAAQVDSTYAGYQWGGNLVVFNLVPPGDLALESDGHILLENSKAFKLEY